MIFCSKCFSESEIQAKINDIHNVGDCPVCGSKNVPLYDTSINSSLDGIFDSLIYIYSTKADLPSGIPDFDLHPISYIFKNDWSIFAGLSEDKVLDIIKAISPNMYSTVPELFDQPVGIAEKYDSDYLLKHSILKTGTWHDFVDGIKHKNRFHTQSINLELLSNYCRLIAEDIPISSKRYYRGRIANSSKGFSPSEMGAPPPSFATAGRANSDGISRLYLTYDRETTFHEIRAAEFDYITIGTFKQLVPLKIVNLSRISRISPLSEDTEYITELAINKDNLSLINEEMAKTMRRGDSPLDYLPTQYICDFVMSIEDELGKKAFDGISYKSAMNDKGNNLTIFNPNSFKCTYSRTYEITRLKYSKKVCR